MFNKFKVLIFGQPITAPPGIIAFTLYTKVLKYLGASLTGFTLYIFSIYSAIYGIILFDEALLNFHYFGAAFVFAGVYLARKIKS